MIENLPLWITFLFITIVIVTIGFFHFSNNKPKGLTLGIILWSILHAILAYMGFYQDTEAIPPRFAFVLIPIILFILYTLLPKNKAEFVARRNTKISTFLHVVRLPIELILFQLFLYQMVPELMTFEGRNFDIIAGITAPIIGILHLKNKIENKILLGWNCIALLLVLFIFCNGVLSAELPIQMLGFDQPNKAVTYFPFILLPATIVPIVIWTHIIDIITLWRRI